MGNIILRKAAKNLILFALVFLSEFDHRTLTLYLPTPDARLFPARLKCVWMIIILFHCFRFLLLLKVDRKN